MREIKFRAKRLDNGEWVEGDYIRLACVDMVNDDIWGTAKFEEQIKHTVYSNSLYYTIDLETLCQFTGLYDKNGKEIWEGDIVVNAFGEKYVVELGFDDGEHCPMSKLQIPNKNFREVIGNKFDNPEILEGENG